MGVSANINSKPSMNPVLKEFWKTPSRIKILHGGRSSSKSWDAAAHSVRVAQSVNVRILCTRMFQNRIEDSVYNLINSQIDRFGQRHKFTSLKNKISCTSTGSEYLFYGIARNIDEIKSLEGVDILWIEEAHNLTEEMWDVLEPTIRKEGSEIWIVFNPKLVTDFVYQRFVVNPPPNCLVKQINYPDNPFLSQTMIDTIETKKEEDEEKYRHQYLGEPLTDDDLVVIKRSWVLAAIDAHKKLNIEVTGSTRVGYDVADSGRDKNATTLAKGFLCVNVEEWQGQEHELMKSCSRVFNLADEQGAKIIYDSIGVGAGCGSKFEEINADKYGHSKVDYTPFNAGGKIDNPDMEYEDGILNKDMFSNIKAQLWWSVADRFRNTYIAVNEGKHFEDDELISISSDCHHLEKLITELSTPQRDFDNNGRVKVESKKDLEKRDIMSPNLADSFVMAYYVDNAKTYGLIF